jgi:hypothetical protein
VLLAPKLNLLIGDKEIIADYKTKKSLKVHLLPPALQPELESATQRSRRHLTESRLDD